MAEEKDYYKILGVDKNATPEQIKSAYKKVAIKYHPDRNPGDKEAEEKFKEAAEAYDVLSDADKRARYDQFGAAGVNGAGGFGGFGGQGMDINDIFSHFGDIFGDMGFGGFGGFGGGRRQGGRPVYKGGDLKMKVKLSLAEIATGVTKKFKVRKDVVCDHCHGSGCADGHQPETCQTCHGTGYVVRNQRTMLGMVQTQQPCPTCQGEGTVVKDKCTYCHGEGIVKGEEVIDLDIPAGVAEGMQLSVRGKGNAGAHNGIAGDLLILIEEEKHPQLERDGSNLIYHLFISFPQAALGCNIDVPSINGSVNIKIPAGTQSGDIIRIKGKGLPEINSYSKGELIVNINVWTPKKMTKDEEQMMRTLLKSENFKPKPTANDKSILDKIRDFFN